MQPKIHATSDRLVGIDAFRILASLSTVWLHSVVSPALAASSAIGRFAVPFFCFIAGLFLVSGVARAPDRPLGAYAKDRFVRLYVPFLFWTTVFFAARSVNRLMVTDSDPLPFGLFRFWAGTAEHLWFLPFLLCVSVIAFPIVRYTAGNERRELIVGLTGVFLGLFIATLGEPAIFGTLKDGARFGTDYFLSRSWDRVPSFIWGVSLGLLWRFRPDRMRLSWPESIAGGVVAVSCIAFVWVTGRNSALENLAGLGIAAFAFGPWKESTWRVAAALGSLSYGVYLAHPLFTQGFRSIGGVISRRMGAPDAMEHWWFDVGVFAASAACALVLSATFRASRYTRWIIADRGPSRLTPRRTQPSRFASLEVKLAAAARGADVVGSDDDAPAATAIMVGAERPATV